MEGPRSHHITLHRITLHYTNLGQPVKVEGKGKGEIDNVKCDGCSEVVVVLAIVMIVIVMMAIELALVVALDETE